MYARLYDLSRSEPEKMKELCVQVLCNGDSLEIVKDFLELANQQCPQGFKTRDIVKESLRTVLYTYRYVYYPGGGGEWGNAVRVPTIGPFCG
jgi:hypothetical protein